MKSALLALSALAALAPSAMAASAPLTPLKGKTACLRGKGCTKLRGASQLRSVAASPNGRTVYAGSVGSASIVVLKRNSRTGALTQLRGKAGCVNRRGSGGCTRAPGLAQVESIALSPDGGTLYAGGSALSTFGRNTRTGALKPRGGALATAGGGDLAIPSDGKHVYATTSSGIAIFVRGASGQLTAAGSAPATGKPEALAFSPNGASAYVATDRVGADQSNATVLTFTRDPAGGQLTQTGCLAAKALAGCGDAGFQTQPQSIESLSDIAVTGDGRRVFAAQNEGFEGAEHDSGALAQFTRDPGTGALTAGPGAPNPGGLTDNAGSLALSSDGRTAYLTGDMLPNLRALSIDPASGATKLKGCIVPDVIKGCASSAKMDFPADLALVGRHAYLADASNLLAYRVR